MHSVHDPDFSHLETMLLDRDDVAVQQQGTRKLFARQGRTFCVLCEGRCNLKLAPLRVSELLKQKAGKRSRPAPDRSTWEWICLAKPGEQALVLANEAYTYAASLENCGPSRFYSAGVQ